MVLTGWLSTQFWHDILWYSIVNSWIKTVFQKATHCLAHFRVYLLFLFKSSLSDGASSLSTIVCCRHQLFLGALTSNEHSSVYSKLAIFRIEKHIFNIFENNQDEGTFHRAISYGRPSLTERMRRNRGLKKILKLSFPLVKVLKELNGALLLSGKLCISFDWQFHFGCCKQWEF